MRIILSIFLLTGQTYYLKDDLTIKQNDRSGSLLELAAGDAVILTREQQHTYTFRALACPGPHMNCEFKLEKTDETVSRLLANL
jgi:hypothetical protein